MLFLSLIANSADPDEMQHHAAFHLGPQCWPKYPLRGFQNTKIVIDPDKNILCV